MKNHILIVEDDEAIREGVRILLEGEGYTVQEAEDGFQCLKKLSAETDLIILDIMMPEISGIKTCEEIRKTSHVPVLFLTAKGQESDKLIGLMAGGDDLSGKTVFLRGASGKSESSSSQILCLQSAAEDREKNRTVAGIWQA